MTGPHGTADDNPHPASSRLEVQWLLTCIRWSEFITDEAFAPGIVWFEVQKILIQSNVGDSIMLTR